MKDIDFLPARYREENAQRKKHFWRVVVVTVFAGLLSLAAFGLYQRRRAVELDLAKAGERHVAVMARSGQLQVLNAEIKALRARADLIVFLRHPWPRSRILAAALRPLPVSVSLDSIQILRDRPQTASAAFVRGGSAASSPGGEAAAPILSPAEQDLERLREEFGALETVVALEGATSDTMALHAYLGELAGPELFAEAKLLALEAAEGESKNVFRFSVRLVTRPGHGQTQFRTNQTEMAVTAR